MKKLTYLFILAVLFSVNATAQKYLTKNGYIKFYSHAPLEDIEAHNYQVNSALDTITGEFVFKVLIKSFEFDKALMQEHFNENYMESDKYPDATFKGKVINIDDINFSKDGIYKAKVAGDLTIHGVTNKLNMEGSFMVDEKNIKGDAVFTINLNDYKIKVPGSLTRNISEEIEITVDIDLKSLK